jgi:hypothetical protein
VISALRHLSRKGSLSTHRSGRASKTLILRLTRVTVDALSSHRHRGLKVSFIVRGSESPTELIQAIDAEPLNARDRLRLKSSNMKVHPTINMMNTE